ncbi:hypothetical protein [uncultured Victivallis sp.]|uniref:hypothetical protein n=1 Tax=uncultured Victivallis sp. TaxID=354118 RepID=UPI0025E63598|nr:hypothetical protein [uncultured Victivallis sp.]
MPGLIAIKQNPNGKAKEIVLVIAKAEDAAPQEIYENLFGEQNVFCCGMIDLMLWLRTFDRSGLSVEDCLLQVHSQGKVHRRFDPRWWHPEDVITSNTARRGEYNNIS